MLNCWCFILIHIASPPIHAVFSSLLSMQVQVIYFNLLARCLTIIHRQSTQSTFPSVLINILYLTNHLLSSNTFDTFPFVHFSLLILHCIFECHLEEVWKKVQQTKNLIEECCELPLMICTTPSPRPARYLLASPGTPVETCISRSHHTHHIPSSFRLRFITHIIIRCHYNYQQMILRFCHSSNTFRYTKSSQTINWCHHHITVIRCSHHGGFKTHIICSHKNQNHMCKLQIQYYTKSEKTTYIRIV